ncbi:hypothetical protein [Staphylococcus warneri]|uniref:hypothetical protein n=1 Tax=Staphylococcus warneri TaxID=1292 RepID=UPI00066EDF6C|nr:hypothetical protein [Staphylococcus warneri]AXZ24457.1 hypothetical protein D3P10_12270 [Staphylococcus warneri]KTW09052.1 hypothetical protein NS346_02240 [Staphylococcus warneri]MBP3032610.1 hypothetical protein [Staphylococcus warneri]MCM3070450.1 hypothetical protein [Staphylococcus warneri]OIS44521.1 hypothetical protein A4A23_04885 [Staphylococcus warneri]
MENKGFMISNLLNILLMFVVALGVIDNHLILAIAFAIVAIINAGYLLYKSNEINKQNEGQSHGKKS